MEISSDRDYTASAREVLEALEAVTPRRDQAVRTTLGDHEGQVMAAVELTGTHRGSDGVKFRVLSQIAWLTRRFQPWGIDRILRLIYNPDRRTRDYFEAIVPYDCGFRINVSSASFIEWTIFFYGRYEPEVIYLLKRVLRPGFYAIDAGANIGSHTLIMSALAGGEGRIVAVEPHPDVYSRLVKNLELNNIRNVEPVQLALSDSHGPGTLYSFHNLDANRGKSSLVFHPRAQNSVPVAVRCTTIDALVKERGFPRLDFVKIDIEGCEHKALRGAAAVLRAHHPLIVFEYDRHWWEDAGCAFGATRKFLEGMGYALGIVRSRGVVDLRAYPPASANIFAAIPAR